MANYNSEFTGAHNDEYDSRISSLEPIVSTLNNTTIPNMQSTFNSLFNNVITFRSSNPTTIDTDTKDTWVNLLPGFYWYGALNGVNGQPTQWGWLMHIHNPGSAEIFQVWFDMGSKTSIYVRGANSGTTTMPNFYLIGGSHQSYGMKKWAATTLNSSTTSTSQSMTLTTHGRPVFLTISGDLNPMASESTWFTVYFYRDSTELCRQICQSNASSCNNPFSLQYLDTPAAGTYTYKATITRGAGTCNLAENGASQAPQFIIFEI